VLVEKLTTNRWCKQQPVMEWRYNQIGRREEGGGRRESRNRLVIVDG
jgi:hypothetical protein